ncbi:hypothetical protein GUITHDRAFT_112558 [Guillardia theta CCMP2712]|uniref:Protein LTV1 homolog n=3 Tax=Guillardia theta TaxID=55529 RepID=L1IZ55_GUITC|nr:hypothetical protein GUITHDRAFT_112558 [Guillardia theta CCMP2712]EKX41347.1 hypothetical protein GUITHDRAFT_112558 [Guillardia theta CCMP2712]|eukprot:XP_005828327.1 hypothetical protein GUITHDRAFT_112558 [Guillardia theta CCMP2712]
MGKHSKPFIDRKNATVYRLVHPDEQKEGDNAGVGKLAKVYGDKNYFSDDDEEEYPYRSDSGDEEEDLEQEEWEEEDEGEEGVIDDHDDQFDDAEGADPPEIQPGIWKRTDEDAKSEYTSWSKRTASSYLAPERRKQLWKDIEEFGLPDDGYDYTQHLRNPGHGVRLDAQFPTELKMQLEKKTARMLQDAPKPARDVLATLDSQDTDDEEAPALEEDKTMNWVDEGKKLIEEGKVVEQGDLDDDFIHMLNDGEDGEGDDEPDPLLSQPRDLRLLDERFEVFLQQYDDDNIGELTEEVCQPPNAAVQDEEYYYNLLQSYIHGTAAPTGNISSNLNIGSEGQILQEGFEEMEEEDEELREKTRALALEAGEESEESLEEVEVEKKQEWDCESILSTYSNIYNRPKVIEDSKRATKILLDRKGLPVLMKGDEKAKSHVTKEAVEAHEEEDGETDSDDEASICTSTAADLGPRRRGETAEEKKMRKEVAKQLKAQAREKKKLRNAAAKAEKSSSVAKPSTADPRVRQGLSITRYS